ncbi:hypothetical protein Tco_0758502 [Tanacetum coccineum]
MERPSCLLVSRRKRLSFVQAEYIVPCVLFLLGSLQWDTLTFYPPYVPVDGMARIYPYTRLHFIPLYWDGDLTTMKFIHAEVECSSSPIFTSKDIWPSGQMVSPLNLVRMLLRPRYIRCTKCPPISASMIIGPSVPSSSPRGGKDIVVSGEKLWVTFCLATLSHGWIFELACVFSFFVPFPPS